VSILGRREEMQVHLGAVGTDVHALIGLARR
jgi:hypothetical protein